MSSTNIIKEIEKRRNTLLLLLEQLAYDTDRNILKTTKDKNDYYMKLEGIYRKLSDGTDFRHSYSDIFIVLSSIDSKEDEGSIDFVAENLYELYQYAINKPNKVLATKIQKLYDHVNLDVARINYVKAIDRRYTINGEKVSTSLKDMESELNKTKDELEEYVEKVDNAQKESITILGIFSAVVLAFIGGITFTSSVLSNINSVSIYRLLMLAIVIGFVFINAIWILLDYIKHINKKTRGRGWSLILIDVILIVAFVFTCLAYNKNWLDKENRLTEERNITEYIVITTKAE